MKTAIVTSCDSKYLPGVKALYASCVKNTFETDFFLLAHGDPNEFKSLNSSGIKILFNKNTVSSPTSHKWKDPIPAMYSRLMIPRLFREYDRVLWLDADTLVLSDLEELFYIDLEGQPAAAQVVYNVNNLTHKFNFMAYQFENPKDSLGFENIFAPQAGVVLFDIKQWHALDLDKAVDNALTGDIKFKWVVQGFLGYALQGRFLHLEHKWNARANEISSLEGIKILHYVGSSGGSKNPWLVDMNFSNIWTEYYNDFM